VPQDLHGSPFPEGQLLGAGEVEDRVDGQVADPDACLAAVAAPPFVACGPDPLVGAVFEGEGLAGRQRGGVPQEFAEAVVAVFEVRHQGRQRGLPAADPVIDAFLGAPLVSGEAAERVVGDRAGATHCAHFSGSSTAQLCRSV
jgi:hypothetical protein